MTLSGSTNPQTPLIEEQLTDELLPLDALTGLESAVVQSFLNLSAQDRTALINDYSHRHGTAAATWLTHAAQLWPTQRLGVSRVTIARLFALLPEHMEQAQRLQLAESIWHVARAPSTATLRVPAGYRNHPVLRELVHNHFMAVLPSVVELPDALRASLPWLADPALQAQHQVLNLLLLAERDQLLMLVDEQIAVLFARRMEGLEIRSRVSIAGHDLLIRTDTAIEEPQLIKRRRESAAARTRFNDRAPKSALIGAAIGIALALVAGALISVL